MNGIDPEQPQSDVAKAGMVSALLIRPAEARTCFVFAHGAGAGMAHPFMATVAQGLGERGVASLRYQLPYMEKGSNPKMKPPARRTPQRAAGAAAGNSP